LPSGLGDDPLRRNDQSPSADRAHDDDAYAPLVGVRNGLFVLPLEQVVLDRHRCELARIGFFVWVFRRNDNLIAPARDCFPDHHLTEASVVTQRRINVVDAQVEGAVEALDRLVFMHIGFALVVQPYRQSHRLVAQRRNLDSRSSKSPVLHDHTLLFNRFSGTNDVLQQWKRLNVT